MTSYVYTVGPTGRTYPTIQAAWNALPATMAIGDDYTITVMAGLYTVGLDCTVALKTLNGTVLICPEAGAAWHEVSGAPNIPIGYDNTKGVAIETAGTGRASFYMQDRVSVRGMQIAGDYAAFSYNATAPGVNSLSRNLIKLGPTVDRAIELTVAGNFNIFNNVIISAATGNYRCVVIPDTNGYVCNVVGNTIYSTAANTSSWLNTQYGTGLVLVDNAIFGYSGAMPTGNINTAASKNNATDLATFAGSANVVNLVGSSQFTNVTTDLRPKAGSGLVAGITNALLTIDALGQTRAATPTIGAAEYTAPASALSGGATLDDMTASGSITSIASSLSGSVTLDDMTASGSMGAAPGVITSPILKNNTGTILASVTGIVANVYHPTTGALIVRKTGLTSSAGGIVTITDALLAAGTTYAYELDLSATTQGRRLPTGVAA